MTRRRRPKCGLSGSAAEHAVEFQNARHEALDAIHDASQAMRKQKCLIAGKRIDDGYIAIGKMQATAQTGEELAETSRVHAALEKADNPFETSCVRDTPIAPSMARKDGASALFRQNAGLADVTGHGLTHLEFDRATVSFHEDGSDWFVAQNIGVYARTADTLGVVLNGRGDLIAGTMAVASARSRLAQRDRLVVELDSPGRVRANFAWVRLSLRDAEALSVWLDNLEAQGLAGIDPTAALIAASIPMGVPGIPFVGLGATPEELDAAAQRWAAQHGTEEYEADEGDAEATAKGFKPKTKEELDLFRQQLDAQEAEEKARGKKDPHPPTGPAAPFRKEMMGTPASSTRIYNVTLSGKSGAALKRRVREYPRELHDGTRVFRLDSADEEDGTVVYVETTGQAQQPAPAKAAPRRVVVRAKPKADVPQVDPFAPLPPVPEAIGPAPAPAPAPVTPKPSAQASAEEQWLAERARMKAPAKEPVKNLISAAQLAPYQYARNESDHMLEVLFRIPGVEGLSPAETILKSQLAVARMPETLTVDGVVLTRGMLQSLPGGQPVVSYRAFKEAGAFVPHFPTPDQRAANDALLNYQSLFAAKQANILPAGEWTEETSRARLVFKPEALARINIFNPDAPRSFHAPEKLELFHGKRREHVRVEMKAFGKGMAFEVPIAKLRENPAQWPAGRYTVQVGFEPAQAIAVWLAKSANAGLGAVGAELPDQLEVSADAFSYFELGTHTAVFDTPLRVTFSVGGPNHIVFIDVAARDSRTQLHRRGAFKVLGAFEPEFRQRGTARGLSEQRYSDPAHLSFQLTPTALARLQVWLDAQEERGALFGLGSESYADAAQSWANNLLRVGLPDAGWFFDSVRGAPGKGYEHLPFLYISGYRPIPVGWSSQFPEGTVVQVNEQGTRGVVRAPSPLDPAVVAKLELTPMRPASVGAFLWAVLNQGGRLELAKDYGERSRFIFKNPRGIWQMSEFEMDIGPTGHIEAGSPEELTWEAFSSGYRLANTGATDAIMEGLR